MDLKGVREHSLMKVAETISGHSMLAESDRVLVAFSGGADSTATAILLDSMGYEVILAHVDHGMRPDSHADAIHCAEVASRLELPYLSRTVSVLPPTEAMARDARYAALEEMAAEAGATRIATGHTMDDDAETVAMRLDRGGYGIGIPPKRRIIIRPLLDLRRSQTEAICREAGIDFLSDPSNLDLRYERNRVRAELTVAGEVVIQDLVALGRSNAIDVAAGRALAEEIVSASDRTENMTVMAEDALKAGSGSNAEQAIRLAASRFTDQITAGAMEEVLTKVLGRTGSRAQLAPDLWAWAEPGTLVIGRTPHQIELDAFSLSMGSNVLPGWDIEMSVGISPPSPIPADVYVALLDRAVADMPLTLRSWQPGDRFHPLGAPGTRKLHDFFIDNKIPRRLRGRIPVVLSGDLICWVVGYRIDERFKVKATTHEAIRMHVSALTIDQLQG